MGRREKFAQAACVLLTAAGALAFDARSALAAELSLTWQAPAGCPDVRWARARISARVGRPLRADGAPGLVATVEIRGSGDGHEARLTTAQGGETGARTLRGQSCEEVADAIALVLALAIDPGASLVAPTQPAQEAHEPQAAAPPAAAPGALRPARERWTVAAGAALWGDLGSLPGVGVGPSGWLALEWGRLRLELSAGWLPPETARAESGRATGRARVSLWTLSPALCVRAWAASGETLRLSPCLGVELGRQRAAPSGLSPPERGAANQAWRSPVLTLRASWQALRRLGLVAELGLAVPLRRPRFVILNEDGDVLDAVHRAAAVAGRLRIGAELRF